MADKNPEHKSGKKRPLSRGMMMLELALKKGKKCDPPRTSVQPDGDWWNRSKAGTASTSDSQPVTGGDYGKKCDPPRTSVQPDGDWWNRSKAGTASTSDSQPVTGGDYGTVLETAGATDQPVITEHLCFEDFVTFIDESDFDLLETFPVNDAALDDSDHDECGQEKELADVPVLNQVAANIVEEEADITPKKKKGVNYRKQNMENRELGKEYKGKKKVGREIKEVTHNPRSIGHRCHHGCNEGKIRNKGGQQCENMSEEQRQTIFGEFWKMTWEQRKVYVSAQIEACPTKRQTTKDGQSRKSRTYKYRLQVDNKQVTVCQTMFLSTLNIGAWSVHEWAKSDTGMHQAQQQMPSRSHSKQDGSAQAFLDTLPKVESHYCRRDSKKMYLEPLFSTFSSLYREYQTYCGEHSHEAASVCTLRTVFKQMNLSLFKPKKDQCDVCVQYEEGNKNKEAYEKHIKLKDMARRQKTLDKEKYAEDESTVVLTVDLEAVLLAPALMASALYYKTKLACHNYTIYDLHSHDAKCYFWHEGEGGLDADTFATCLLDYLNENERCKAASTIIIYSDGCTYQNRNKTLANALYDFCCQTKKTVFQKILEKGHTQMECDSVHAACERALRDKKIYVPSNYKRYIEEACQKHPYKVEYLKHGFFKTYTDLTYYSTIRPGHKVGDQVVTDIRQLKYQDGSLDYKLDYSESSEFLPLPQRCMVNTGSVRRKYTARPTIKKSKYDDLQALKAVLPEDCHAFYDGLPHN